MMARTLLLIMKDQPDLLSILSYILEVTGYKVAVVRNGEETFDYLGQHPLPALIFLDLTVPLQHGLTILKELASSVHAGQRAIPVVVMSAVEHLIHVAQFPCASTMSVPVSLEKILRAAEQFASAPLQTRRLGV